MLVGHPVAGIVHRLVRPLTDAPSRTDAPVAPLEFAGPAPSHTAVQGTAFLVDFAPYFRGGVRPLTYALASGALPSTITLDPSTGRAEGVYPTPGGYAGLSIKATDSVGASVTSNTFTLTSQKLVIPVAFNGTLPAANGVEGALFSLNLAPYFSGTETPFTYAAAADPLPTSLSVSGAVVGGTYPAAKANLSLAFRATDALGNTATSNAFALTSASAGPVQFSGTIPTQTGVEGSAFSLDLKPYFTGAKKPFTHALAGAALPGTLTLDTAGGTISGTYPAPGSYAGLSIRVTDALGDTATSNLFSLTSTRLIVPIAFSGTLPAMSGTEGDPFNVPLAPYFSGTETPFTYARNSGPAVGTLDINTGAWSGAYPAPGASSLSFKAVDSASNVATTNTFTLTSVAAVVPIAFTGTVPNFNLTVGTPFSYNFAQHFTGSLTPFDYWRNSGVWPAGLSLNAAGLLSGTPASVDPRTGVSVGATDTGGNNATSNAFSFAVQAAPVVNQYFEDWSASTIGAEPTGWSKRWEPTGVNYEVIADAAGPAGRALRISLSTSAYRMISMDAVDADSKAANFKLRALIRVPANPGYDAALGGVSGRAAGTAGNHSAYYVVFQAISSQPRLALRKYLGGGNNNMVYSPFNLYTPGDLYWLGLEVTGTNVRTTLAHQSNPSVLLADVSTSDTSLSAAGWVGLLFGDLGAAPYYIYAVGIGTGGAEAPLGPV